MIQAEIIIILLASLTFQIVIENIPKFPYPHSMMKVSLHLQLCKVQKGTFS